MKFYNGGCRREESLGNGFYLIQIKNLAAQAFCTANFTGNLTYGEHLPTGLGQILFNSNKSFTRVEGFRT